MAFNLLMKAASTVMKIVKPRKYRCTGFCGPQPRPRLLSDAYCDKANPNGGIVLVCGGCERVIDVDEVRIEPLKSGKHDTVYYETLTIVKTLKWYRDRYATLGIPKLLTDCKSAHQFLTENRLKDPNSPLNYYNPLLIEFRKLLPVDFPDPSDRSATLLADLVARYGSKFVNFGLAVESKMSNLINLEGFFKQLYHEKVFADLFLSDRELFFRGPTFVRESGLAGYAVVVFPKVVEALESAEMPGVKPVAKGRIINYLIQAYNLRPHLKNVVQVDLHKATKVILLRNNLVVKEFAAESHDSFFFVISLSKDKPNVIKDKPSLVKVGEPVLQLTEFKVSEHFGEGEAVLLYNVVQVLKDSKVGKKVDGEYLLLIGLKKED